MNQHAEIKNPYPGLEPYTSDDQAKFFGRDADCDILMDKILTHRLTLLFAASGVGKSSLLQAAVIPQLSSAEGENLDVVYYTDWVSDPLETLSKTIIETLKSKQRLPDDFLLSEVEGIDTLDALLGFCDVFVRSPLVIVLDQFEEFFRYQRHNKQPFQAFINQLTQVITQIDVSVSVVISMREDFALEMNAFKPKLPTVLFENFYRLEKLDRAGAESAIRISVEQVGYQYQAALLTTLLDDLENQELKRQTEQLVSDGVITSIEPPYLQIVCKQLWALNEGDKDRTLRLSTYQQAGGAEGLLRNFLEHSLIGFSKQEKNLVSAAFDHLVAQRGVKMAYPVALLAKVLNVRQKPLQRLLKKLSADRLRILRVQQRGDTDWYELYHDMFSPSIDSWNTAWKLQRQKKRRWVMGSVIALLLLTLVILIDSILWMANNNFPASAIFQEQKFRLMEWGFYKKPYPKMIKITADNTPFTMGDDKEWVAKTYDEQHHTKFGVPNTVATLSKDFEVGEAEVTYEQFDYYVWKEKKAGKEKVVYPPSTLRDLKRGQKAVTYVSWHEAVAYTEWLNGQLGKGFRLPTEAEWEYVARAHTTTTYWWGETVGDNQANCEDCGSEWDNKRVAPVKQFKANPFELYDTVGNVWEWTCSPWRNGIADERNTCDNESSDYRVLRGGSWGDGMDQVRSSARLRSNTGIQNDSVGFRVVRFSAQDK